MIRNLDEILVDLSGVPILQAKKGPGGDVQTEPDPSDPQGKQRKVSMEKIPLYRLVAELLGTKYRDEENMGYKEQLERGLLARKISKGGNIELDAPEIAKIQQIVAKGCNSISAVLQIGEALERELVN